MANLRKLKLWVDEDPDDRQLTVDYKAGVFHVSVTSTKDRTFATCSGSSLAAAVTKAIDDHDLDVKRKRPKPLPAPAPTIKKPKSRKKTSTKAKKTSK